MDILFNILLLVVGTALILVGADKLTEGASALARRMQVSELVIGLTVVAFGTSLPEFVVSFFSALKGVGDMSAGNIVGSNVFNTLVIVGATAALCPIAVRRGMLRRDVSYSIIASIALLCVCVDGNVERTDGVLLFMFFCIFMFYTISIALHKDASAESGEGTEDVMPLWKSFAFLLFGGAALIGGGQLLVNAASEIARAMKVSEAVIGLTIVAGGTSLPELATSMVAARRGSSDMAIGNAIGSNIFNAFFVLGLCPIISPMQVTGLSSIDWLALVGSGVLLWIFGYSKQKINRTEGLLLLSCYAAYLSWLIYSLKV